MVRVDENFSVMNERAFFPSPPISSKKCHPTIPVEQKTTARLNEEGAKNDCLSESSAHSVQKLASRSSLAQRVAARGGFTAPSLNIAKTIEPSSSSPDVRPPYLTVPPGLSPTSFLDSPVFLSNSPVSWFLNIFTSPLWPLCTHCLMTTHSILQAQLSPTTGKLSFAMLGEKLSNQAPEIEYQSPQNIAAPHFSLKQQFGIRVS